MLLSSTEGWSSDVRTELDANNGTTGVSNIFKFQQSPILLAERRKGKRRGMRGKKKRMRMFRAEPCANCEGLEGFVPPNEIDDKIRKMVVSTVTPDANSSST